MSEWPKLEGFAENCGENASVKEISELEKANLAQASVRNNATH